MTDSNGWPEGFTEQLLAAALEVAEYRRAGLGDLDLIECAQECIEAGAPWPGGFRTWLKIAKIAIH